MSERALITGVTGMDGSHMADLLIAKGYEVHGLLRHSASPNHWRIDHLKDSLRLHYGDMTDEASLYRIVRLVQPDEVYNFAALSFVPESWNSPSATAEVTGLGPVRLLNAIRDADLDAKFFQASSSEMFGLVRETPQNEATPFYPRSPYGAAKAYAHYMVQNYRESYGMFACSGIMFNHEGPRRGEQFVTQKVCKAAADFFRHRVGKPSLKLGNLDAERDWGWAPDYMQAAWMMLQQDHPDDYVIASGETHTVKHLLKCAFGSLSMEWQAYVETDESLLRLAEVPTLCGDASKAEDALGWGPTVGFADIVERMVQAQLDKL